MLNSSESYAAPLFFSAASGSLMSIIDRNGNATSLTYDALNRLVMVTDSAGRHLYFDYIDASSYLVSGVRSRLRP